MRVDQRPPASVNPSSAGASPSPAAPRVTRMNDASQQARDGAWNAFRAMGLRDARLQAVWSPTTQGMAHGQTFATAAGIAYDGIQKYGLDGYQRLVRGGTGGVDAKGMSEYTDAVRNTRAALAGDPALMHDGRRYGQSVSER